MKTDFKIQIDFYASKVWDFCFAIKYFPKRGLVWEHMYLSIFFCLSQSSLFISFYW